MKFKKFIKKVWYKCKRLFYKRTPTADMVISESKEVLSADIIHNEFIDKIQESSDIIIKEALLKQLAKFETAKSIIHHVEYQPQVSFLNNKNKKKFYELHELRDELQKLNERKVELEIIGSKIYLYEFENPIFWDNRINELRNLLNKNKLEAKIKLTNTTNSSIDNSINQIENLFKYNSVLLKLKTRENEKLKQQKIYENKISKELGTLEYYITQNKYNEAKELSKLLSISIKPNDKHNTKRFNKALEKLKDKELSVYVQSREELLRKQTEEARNLKHLQDVRKLKLEEIKAQQKKALKIEFDKKAERERKLNLLLNKKSNWRDFQKILQANGINRFYHFTDFSNLKSIVDYGGLYSWHFADSNGIVISFPGGGVLSRDLDRKFGLHDYVRVSICEDHPMQYGLIKQGRKLALLEVDVEIAYFENTLFCNINAAGANHQIGNELKDLEKIKFSATKKKYVNREDPDFKYHQAEVLVKTWIPLDFIKNIKNFA